MRFGLGGGNDAELRCIGATEDHEAGGTQLRGEVRILGRPPVQPLEQLHAGVVGIPHGFAAQVFEEKRHTAKRTVRELGRSRLGARLFEAGMDDGVQLGIELLDARNRSVDELERTRLPASNELSLCDGVEAREVVGHWTFLQDSLALRNDSARPAESPARDGYTRRREEPMARRPQLGVILPAHGISFARSLELAQACEAAGLDRLWVPDHLMNDGRPRAGVLEAWTLLAAAAAVTERIQLGTLVLVTPFRHPPLLAKQAATLGDLAPERFTLGLGAGGFTYAQACRQFGFPRLSAPDRVDHVEECVRCLRTLWSDDPATFIGRFSQTREVRIHPRPARPIPIVLAARGPRMLKATAEVADGWNCPVPSELASGLAVLEGLGRPRASIDVSVFAIAVLGESEAAARQALARAGPAAQLFGDVERHHLFGDPPAVAARITELGRQGADHVALDLRGQDYDVALELLMGEVLPRLGDRAADS